MKVLVVLCAVVASCLAKPGYVAPASYSYSSSVVSVSRPALYTAPASTIVTAPVAPAPLAYAAAPAPLAYSAPAPVAYAAHAPVAYAGPAPVAYAAPAPVVPAPAPVAYAAPVPAPAPVAPVVAAPAPIAPVAYAAPAPVAPVVAAAPAAVKSQYHAQNEHGEASYGHAEPGQVHNAVQDAHGNKIGSFSYVNPDGHVLRTDYVADAAGYRVASNALPAAPVAAPVVHARRRRSAVYVQTPASTAPLAIAPAVYPAPSVYSVPAVYAAPAAAPVPAVYAAPAPVPAVYSASVAAPAVYAAPAPAPAVLPATLTTVVNNPGHAVSYRVD